MKTIDVISSSYRIADIHKTSARLVSKYFADNIALYCGRIVTGYIDNALNVTLTLDNGDRVSVPYDYPLTVWTIERR